MTSDGFISPYILLVNGLFHQFILWPVVSGVLKSSSLWLRTSRRNSKSVGFDSLSLMKPIL